MPKHVGSSPVRVDGLKKVTATATYVPAMRLPNMLHVAVARSERPHARIVAVHTEQAKAVPGVVLVLTGNDLQGIQGLDPWLGPAFKDHPIVAIGKVHFVGEPVAAVAAETEAIAREAAGLVEVEYEDLPAVFDVMAAARPGAPLVHDQIVPSGAFPDLAHLGTLRGTNVCYHYKLRRGNVQTGFQAADHVFEDVFTSPPAQHAPMEPHAFLAEWDVTGKLTVWSTTQTPSFVRVELAEAFGVPLNKVRVVVPYLGGGYGAKMYDKHEPLVALVAKLTGRPAKMILNRAEQFYTITKHGATLRLKTGVMQDGRILARHIEIYWDTGAFADIGPRIAGKTGFASPGPYRIEHVWVDSYCVYTHKTPAGAFRGFGTPQIVWAYERQMDLIARRLGLDPLRYRLEHLLDEGDEFATGTILRGIGMRECVQRAAEAIGWSEQRTSTESRPDHSPLKRGFGLACGLKAVIYPSVSNAVVTLNADASATVYSSTVEMGQGSETTLGQIASEVLGLSLDKVAVQLPDTDVTPYDTITAGSRSTYHMGNAVRLAAEDVRRQVLEAAAEVLETNPADLEMRDEQVVVRGAADRAVSIETMFRSTFGGKGSTVVGQGRFAPKPVPADKETGMTPKSTEFWFPGATAVEVEVDEETGQVRVLRVAAAADVGTAVHPEHCRQQIVGATSMALSLALFEEIVFEDGRVANPNLGDYLLTSFEDLPPEVIPIIVQAPHPDGPFGAKGVGETAIFSLAPAIANAVQDATGAIITELPITHERVLQALDRR